MKRSKIRWYIMSVLAYYRSEWTDVPDDDKEYRLLVTKELEQLIRGCLRRGTSVPNAAKEVEIFLDLEEARANAETAPKSAPENWSLDIKSVRPRKELRVEPKPQEPEDDADD